MAISFNGISIGSGVALTITPPPPPMPPSTVEYLVVAGGGGGGGAIIGGGGGGAGGYRTNTGFSVTSGVELTVTVGAGGSGA